MVGAKQLKQLMIFVSRTLLRGTRFKLQSCIELRARLLPKLPWPHPERTAFGATRCVNSFLFRNFTFNFSYFVVVVSILIFTDSVFVPFFIYFLFSSFVFLAAVFVFSMKIAAMDFDLLTNK